MLIERREEAVVATHHMEALQQGGPMVGRRRAFVEVEGDDFGVEGGVLGLP